MCEWIVEAWDEISIECIRSRFIHAKIIIPNNAEMNEKNDSTSNENDSMNVSLEEKSENFHGF